MNKIIITGLPRTGTTSISVAFLKMGFRVAHCCYTEACQEMADVISDTPAFSDYARFDLIYDNARFIHVQRDIDRWYPSFTKIFRSMINLGLGTEASRFHPLVERSYEKVFGPVISQDMFNPDHLRKCVERHNADILEYFSGCQEKLCIIELSKPGEFERMVDFLSINTTEIEFPRTNSTQAMFWHQVQAKHKVDSFLGFENTQGYL